MSFVLSRKIILLFKLDLAGQHIKKRHKIDVPLNKSTDDRVERRSSVRSANIDQPISQPINRLHIALEVENQQKYFYYGINTSESFIY